MTSPGLIVDMSEAELARYEPLLRPKGASQSGFYGATEDIRALALRDHATVIEFGSSHADAAKCLEKFLAAFEESDQDPDKTMMRYLGFQACPFGCTGPDAKGSSHYYFKFNGKKYNCGSLLPHLIRQHGCYEGEEIPTGMYSGKKPKKGAKIAGDMRVPPEICLHLQ